MQLNVSTCYAMQVMLYLARSDKVVPSAELSKTLHISQRYILQIAAKLRDGGFISAHAGMSGGYALTKGASFVSAYDIIMLMEGDMSIPECAAPIDGCGAPCTKSDLFDALYTMKDYVDTFLQTVTFDKLAGMDFTGHLSDILSLVDAHISEIRLRRQ